MSIEIIPTGAALGAEIQGVDLSQPLGDNAFAVIERAYDEHGVIFFRDQRITPPQQVAFTRRFGEIEFNIFGERWSIPGSPQIVVVSNVTDDGKPIAAPARTGTATCATPRARRAGRCFMPTKSRTFSACRSATPSSPAPPRLGMPCPTA
jgi:alpha-ketoglutarate-dependent taurine dioxygenase